MKKNIYLIPTDKPSRLVRNSNENTLKLCIQTLPLDKEIYCYPQHIYITNSEEIKFDDYITDGYKVWQWKDDSSLLGRKKVIITNDQDLIADSIQDIEDSFLEWFINNPTCDFVETKRIEDGKYVDRFADGSIIEGIYENYKIIIPNDESKQTDENGSPMTFWGGSKKHKKEKI